MWIFSRYGFYSVVAAGPGKLGVRARDKKHLENLIERFAKYLAGASIIETKEADYRYRIMVNRKQWAAIARSLAHDVDYRNFKSEVRTKLGACDYESALHRVWEIMYQLQAKTSAKQNEAYFRKLFGGVR